MIPILFAAALVTITIHADRPPLNTFVPEEAFGAGIDGREYGDAPRTFTKHNLDRMRSAGFTQLTYRLRTELGIEAWHWNPRGSWTDAKRKRGYWTSNVTKGALPDSYGYKLPRRGSSSDQANNDGYSRIDDGDLRTFWKSNPYLDEAFTHESNDEHPQWIAVDFGEPTEVNAIRIAWGEPYATDYSVEYCSDQHPLDFADRVPQCWVAFPQGSGLQFSSSRRSANFKTADLTPLSSSPIKTRFVRILLNQSCRCRSKTTTDIRDRVGYAIRELSIGVIGPNGNFHDKIRHSKKHGEQTEIVASSTDPWHAASDIDRRTEQPSFDRVVRSGLPHENPMMVPVGVLYDTPENAAAEIRWLLSRGYPIRYVEVGEEPDGQYTTPEDFGALFIQLADAIHKVAPSLKLGGPSFQTTTSEYFTMPIHGDTRTWLRRFLDYLDRRGHRGDYAFFSFEWYPFDNGCGDTAPQLAQHVALLTGVLERLQRDGLARDIPWFVSEYGYSAFGNRPEVDIEGAILNAETVALFLQLGGTRTYLYGWEPNTLMDELGCGSFGNNAMFLADDEGQASASTAIYWAARLIDQEWVLPGTLPHAIVATSSSEPLVTAYAVRRPDQKWGLLILNKDPKESHTTTFAADAEVFRYSREQYVWNAKGERGRPVRNEPPRFDRVPAGQPIVLPPYSISVVRIPE